MALTAAPTRGHSVPREVFDFYLHLQERWPKLFNLHRPKPLAIGIDKAIQVHVDVPPGTLKQFFRWYTSRKPYHEAMLTATHRYDLQGQPHEAIDDSARNRARLCLHGKTRPPAATATPTAVAKAQPAKAAPTSIWDELVQHKGAFDMQTQINATLKLVLRETPQMRESEDGKVLYYAMTNVPSGLPAEASLPSAPLYLAVPAKLWRNAQKKANKLSANEDTPVWWMIEGAIGMGEDGLLVYAKSVQPMAGKAAKAA